MKTRSVEVGSKFLGLILLTAGILSLTNCQSGKTESLPYIGEKEIVDGDTVYYTVPSFSYINQDSQTVSDVTLHGKIYVADFFFTSCPTICPKVKQQMLRLHDRFEEIDDLKFLSMSIDYRKDSVPVLKNYAEKLQIPSDRWHLVQLRKDQIEKVANQFFNIAFEDESAPGGFDHSGRLILVDREGHIRAHCDGTDPESVDGFAVDIEKLLHEE